MRWVALLMLVGCSGAEQVAPPPEADAGIAVDAGNAIFEPPVIAAPEPPRIDELAAPVLVPCAEGWREVPAAESGLASAYCEPFPNGLSTCAIDEALFPGGGCVRVGSGCTADPWAGDLPDDRTVLYVQAGAAGGNGTRSAPFGSIAQAIAVTGDGAVIALSKGTFEEAVALDKAVTLWGACVAETVLDPSAIVPAVEARAAGAGIRNLRISGSDVGIQIPMLGALAIEDVVVSGAVGAGILVEGGTLSGARVVIRELADGSYYGRGLVALGGAEVSLAGVELIETIDAAVIAAGAGTQVELTDATIRGTLARQDSFEYGVGALALEGARIELVRAVLDRNRDRGLWAYDGASILASDSVIRNMLPREADDTDGIGAEAQLGATLTLERTLIDRSRTLGIYLTDDGAAATLTDVIVNRTERQSADGAGGRGVNAQLGVDLVMTRVLVKDSHEMGVFVAADSTAKLTDVTIEDTHDNGILGTGLTFNFGATGEIERLRIARATQGGVALGDGSTVTMTDVVIEDTLGLESDRSEGLGLVIQSGSSLTATRLRVERCLDQGVFVRDPGTEATFEDLIVREVESEPQSGRFGRGIGVEVGASATIRRALVEATHEHALIANGSGAVIRAEDLRIDDTRARPSDGFPGRGLAVQADAHAEITRAHFSRSVEVGVFVSGAAATATLTAVLIEATESRSDGVGGRGLDVSQGARVIARGLLLSGNREFGVVVVGDGSRVDLFDAIVTGTRENACPTDECLGFGKGGTGAAAAKNAALRMEHFLVEKSALAGLSLTRGGTIDLFDGEVAFNPVGVNVDAEGYDLDRLRDEVRYHDNELTLQSISLPEPRASEVIAGALD